MYQRCGQKRTDPGHEYKLQRNRSHPDERRQKYAIAPGIRRWAAVTDAYATILTACNTFVSAFSSTDCVTSNTVLNVVHLLTLTGLNETLNYIIKTLHLMDH